MANIVPSFDPLPPKPNDRVPAKPDILNFHGGVESEIF
jgi:hypothetical protein